MDLDLKRRFAWNSGGSRPWLELLAGGTNGSTLSRRQGVTVPEVQLFDQYDMFMCPGTLKAC